MIVVILKQKRARPRYEACSFFSEVFAKAKVKLS